jgi:hypothetical protein
MVGSETSTNITTFDIVAHGYKPAVPASDTAFIEDAIDEAEMILEARLGDLEAWIALATAPAERDRRRRRLQRVVTRMVRRVMRNPSGMASETDGDYSYARASGLASGEVYVAASEWKLLGVRNKGFKTIRVGLPQDSPRNMHHRHPYRRLP